MSLRQKMSISRAILTYGENETESFNKKIAQGLFE